jgi:4-amino-4-deoxy-L-arabinose transferase-like glycosyltransferase
MTRLLYKLTTRSFLVLAVLLATLPFLDLRVLRMAGDEKVYISTAVEMARQGNWFVQTLADEPNYFKGPFHYLAVRAGLAVFGNRLIAGTWINLALAILAGLAMHRLGRKRWGDKSGLLLGIATALNVGVFSHALASQMEVEVLAFYAFATAALGLAASRGSEKPSFKSDVWFWLAAGIAAWIKSPLHSVLIGFGGLLFWLLNGELVSRLKRPGCWLAILAGVAAGIAAYVPILIFDYKNFYDTYILREQFEKANNNRTWDYVMSPLLHFLLPWTFVILGAIARFVVAPLPKRRSALKQKIDLPMIKLALGMALPTLLFWCTWTYKGQNYNLPALPAILLFGWATFKGELPRWALRGAGALGVLAFLFSAALISHFWPLPVWWSIFWPVLALLMMAVFSIAFLLATDVRVLCAGAAAFFIAFGAMITPLGEREMRDIRAFIKKHPNVTLHYYNLEPSIWSEWGLLQLTLHQPIYGVHRTNYLAQAVRPGHAVLVPHEAALKVITDYWKNNPTTHEPIVTPWVRWLTKGKTSDGKVQWRAAWDAADLHQLEREFYIIYFP